MIFVLGMNVSGMGVGNLGTVGAGTLGMGIPGLSNMTGVTSVGGNLQSGDALTQAYSGIQQYNGTVNSKKRSLFYLFCLFGSGEFLH